jgi:flavodoxin
MNSDSIPVRTVIVYHSGYGHTARMAAAVAAGAGTGAVLVAIDAEGNISDDAWQTLTDADAVGGREYFASLLPRLDG